MSILKFWVKFFEQNGLFNKPGSIYNINETGLQLNNCLSHVIVKKASKSVFSVTSEKRRETIAMITCCNAESVYLPLACIMKGKNKKPEYKDGMPPGSIVFMSKRSAYINTQLFFDLEYTFFPENRKKLLL